MCDRASERLRGRGGGEQKHTKREKSDTHRHKRKPRAEKNSAESWPECCGVAGLLHSFSGSSANVTSQDTCHDASARFTPLNRARIVKIERAVNYIKSAFTRVSMRL